MAPVSGIGLPSETRFGFGYMFQLQACFGFERGGHCECRNER